MGDRWCMENRWKGKGGGREGGSADDPVTRAEVEEEDDWNI